MVKRRLCVVVSKRMKGRGRLCTVVPLSTTAPAQPQAYHCELDVQFRIPKPWGNRTRWVKGDMLYSVSFDRADLLLLGKDEAGRRRYQTDTISSRDLARVQACVLHGLSLGKLTN